MFTWSIQRRCAGEFALGRLASVVAYLAGVITGDIGGGVLRTATRILPPGIDAAPIPLDTVFLEGNGGSGAMNALGVVRTGGDASPGEVFISARNLAGVQVSWIRLLSDGSITVANNLGQIVMGATGSINLNGVEIDIMGNITTPIGADVSNGIVTLGTHVHGGVTVGTAVTAPATPGGP